MVKRINICSNLWLPRKAVYINVSLLPGNYTSFLLNASYLRWLLFLDYWYQIKLCEMLDIFLV